VKLTGTVVAVTGGGGGLGSATCRAARARGAAEIVVIDVNGDAAQAVATEVAGHAFAADVGDEAQLTGVIEAAAGQAGPIDVFISNAGVGGTRDPYGDDAAWQRCWQVNVMSNVYAARALLPQMLRRGRGHLVSVASSNALTTNPIDMGYAATKAAQLSVAEWLAMTYGERGIEVTCFCPKGMLTPMLLEAAEHDPYARSALTGAVTPDEAARIMLDAVESARFMAVTYPPVVDEFRLKAHDYEAWVAGAQRLHREYAPLVGRPPA
jgi:NAD(P)-dependent dehydrogenase (short-subunit alcohol dehydrogenase family)